MLIEAKGLSKPRNCNQLFMRRPLLIQLWFFQIFQSTKDTWQRYTKLKTLCRVRRELNTECNSEALRFSVWHRAEARPGAGCEEGRGPYQWNWVVTEMSGKGTVAQYPKENHSLATPALRAVPGEMTFWGCRPPQQASSLSLSGSLGCSGPGLLPHFCSMVFLSYPRASPPCSPPGSTSSLGVVVVYVTVIFQYAHFLVQISLPIF